MPARSEMMTENEISTGRAMQPRKARLFGQVRSGDLVPDIRTAGDVDLASKSRNARQTVERPFQSVLAESAVVVITNATWGDGSVRDQIAAEMGGLGTRRSKEPRGGRAGGPPDDELPAVSEGENPEGNLIRAMIDTLKQEGVVHAMYEGDPREGGKKEMVPIDFTTVSSADGNFRAFLSVRRTGNKAYGDVLSLHWLDKGKGQAGNFSPMTGDLSRLLYKDEPHHAVVITKITENATADWEGIGGAIEYQSLLEDRREMAAQEIRELIAKISSSEPHAEMAEKAMEHLRTTHKAVKTVKGAVVTEAELPAGNQREASDAVEIVEFPDNEKKEAPLDFQAMLERVLERRGVDNTALDFIREHVQFPELLLTPTNSEFKPNFLRGFMQALVPEANIQVKRISVPSGVHENPFGPETQKGAEQRTDNAIALVMTGNTGDPELDDLLHQVNSIGYVGAVENGMVAGTIDNNRVHLDLEKTTYDPEDEHFDVAYVLLHFPPFDSIVTVSPPEEAVRFNPLDADASFASGFNVTAGQCMQERLAAQDPPITVNKQNWHGYAIDIELAEIQRRMMTGEPTVGLHSDEFRGFDRNEQLTGVLFDAFYKLAKRAQESAQDSPDTIDKLETRRGAFYTAQPPDEPTPLTVTFMENEYTFLVPFTEREIAHLRKAREALRTEGFMESAAQDSLVRSIISYGRLPWGGGLQNRAAALTQIENAYYVADNRLRANLPPELAEPIAEYMKYLVPFLPPLEQTNPEQ